MWHRHHQNPKTDSLCCNNHVGFPIKIKLDPESSDIIRNKMGLLAFISLMQSKKVVLNELKRTPDQQIQLKQWKQYKKKKVAQWGKESGTELDKEIEEAANIERNVRDEFTVFPISLHGYTNVHCVCYPSCSCHFSVSGAASVDMNMIMNLWVFGVRPSEI